MSETDPAPTATNFTFREPVTSKNLAFSKKYAFVPKGVLRFFLILTLLASWIAAIFILTDSVYAHYWGGMSSTRNAFLTFCVTGFAYSCFVYAINISQLVHLKMLQSIRAYIEIATLVMDIIFLIGVGSCTIACIVRITEFDDDGPGSLNVYKVYNQQAFAASAAFGLMSSIALFCIILYKAIEYKKIKNILFMNMNG